MKTDHLINALVEDQSRSPGLPRSRPELWLLCAVLGSLLIFFSVLGIRPDFARAITDPHVPFKLAVTASLCAVLGPVVVGAARPDLEFALFLRWLAVPFLVLLSGLVAELATTPPALWHAGLIGHYPYACLVSIPVLSLGPLIALLNLIKNGAPTRPALAGAVAGAGAGAMGALIYAFHCPDDSALFVALWYSVAITGMAGVGAVAGLRWLRW